MIVELHLLQNFAPSCLNRDDTNSPKDCEFGGHRRARISSQCIKRAIREFFQTRRLIPAENLAVRTKRLVREVADQLERDGKDRAAAEQAATVAITAVLPKTARDNNDEVKTPYLLFLGHEEIRRFAELVNQHFDVLSAQSTAAAETGEAEPPARRRGRGRAAAQTAQGPQLPSGFERAVKNLLDGGKAADLALFGRMLADLPEQNVDAACQVAHALSTNRVAGMEMDYYTAVDDLKPDDTAGADMIGTVEFNSSCFYRYADIDLCQLHKNLGGDEELVRRTVEAFLKAAVEAIPTGKQNSMAAQSSPSLVLAVVRECGMWSLANAFVRPVDGRDGGLVANSIKALDDYWGRLVKMFGTPPGLTAAVCTTDDDCLAALKPYEKTSLGDVISTVMTAVNFNDCGHQKGADR
jgi:CRISPR system Cascade subunit CasC